jgi:hypothetical protein
MGTYRVIFYADSEGNIFSQFTIFTNRGEVVLVFSDEASIAEALPYARRSAPSADTKLGLVSVTADSPVEAMKIFEDSVLDWTPKITFAFEGERLFDVLMTQLRNNPD